MAAGAELNHWCFCQLMQIQCVGSAWVLASSPPTAECVFLSLSDSCACLRMEEGLTCVFLTLWPIPCFLRLFVCATRRFGSLSQAGVAHTVTLWPTRGLERRSFSLLSVYQHNAAHRDKWRRLLWYRTGVFRGLDYQHFYEAFSFPLWCIVLVMATGTQQQLSQPHTVENQWLALCRSLWSTASTQDPGHNVLFMRNNQDFTSERVLKWYLWRGLGSAWKDNNNT